MSFFTALPFIDVALFNREPTLRTIFHTLVQVTQFTVLGLERVMKGYFQALNESGLRMVVPYEEQAYRMDARYTKDLPMNFAWKRKFRSGCGTESFRAPRARPQHQKMRECRR
jgi:hypothetical protein